MKITLEDKEGNISSVTEADCVTLQDAARIFTQVLRGAGYSISHKQTLQLSEEY